MSVHYYHYFVMSSWASPFFFYYLFTSTLKEKKIFAQTYTQLIQYYLIKISFAFHLIILFPYLTGTEILGLEYILK